MTTESTTPAHAAETAKEAERHPLDRPWLPWEGAPGRLDLICWYSLSLMGLYYLAMWPVRPHLIGSNPVLLEILAGSKEAIIAAGAFARVGDLNMAVVLAGALIGMLKFDWIYWWAGRLWGHGMVKVLGGRSKRAARFAAKAENLSPWIIWPAVALSAWTPIPSGLIYAVAGWTGMRLWTFIAIDAVGSLIRASVYASLGYAIGQPAVDVAEAISTHALWISLVILAVIGLTRLWRSRRARDAG